MPLNKPIKRIAIVGTGLIGGSWAALYLARGFDVVATDPGPGAEEKLRRYVDAAWEELSVLGLAPKASTDRFSFTLDMKEAVSGADFIQENAPEHSELKIKCSLKWIMAEPAKFSHFVSVAATGRRRDSSKTHRSPVLARLNQLSAIALADASSSQELP